MPETSYFNQDNITVKSHGKPDQSPNLFPNHHDGNKYPLDSCNSLILHHNQNQENTSLNQETTRQLKIFVWFSHQDNFESYLS
jgi:hypothetical protein